jgi:hypothetical protein
MIIPVRDFRSRRPGGRAALFLAAGQKGDDQEKPRDTIEKDLHPGVSLKK